jgi:hypothetical protein
MASVKWLHLARFYKSQRRLFIVVGHTPRPQVPAPPRRKLAKHSKNVSLEDIILGNPTTV